MPHGVNVNRPAPVVFHKADDQVVVASDAMGDTNHPEISPSFAEDTVGRLDVDVVRGVSAKHDDGTRSATKWRSRQKMIDFL